MEPMLPYRYEDDPILPSQKKQFRWKDNSLEDDTVEKPVGWDEDERNEPFLSSRGESFYDGAKKSRMWGDEEEESNAPVINRREEPREYFQRESFVPFQGSGGEERRMKRDQTLFQDQQQQYEDVDSEAVSPMKLRQKMFTESKHHNSEYPSRSSSHSRSLFAREEEAPLIQSMEEEAPMMREERLSKPAPAHTSSSYMKKKQIKIKEKKKSCSKTGKCSGFCFPVALYLVLSAILFFFLFFSKQSMAVNIGIVIGLLIWDIVFIWLTLWLCRRNRSGSAWGAVIFALLVEVAVIVVAAVVVPQ